jgi:hypothetical protein
MPTREQRKHFYRTLRDAINGLIPQIIIAGMALFGFTNTL